MAVRYRVARRDLEKAIKAAVRASRAGGFESCGLLSASGSKLHLLPLKNKRKRPGGFAFYASEVRTTVRQTERTGAEVVGTFHSHPYAPAIPGSTDCQFAADDSLMLVIDVLARHVALWRISKKKSVRIALQKVDAPKPERRRG